MFKIICLLFVIFVLGQTLDRTIEITWGILLKGIGRQNNLLSLNYGRSATNITWNKNISEEENTLKASYEFTYTSSEITQYAETQNLCTPPEKGSFEEVAQTLFLKVIANTATCPIQEGTTVTYSVPFSHSYSINKSKGCGPFRAVFKLFNPSDKFKLNPVLKNIFIGNVTGCQN